MNAIVIDLPAPLSVNRTRRVDWKAHRRVKEWHDEADRLVLSQRIRKPASAVERYELRITLKEGRADLDNGVKGLVDYLRRIEILANDSPKNWRKVTVEWGEAPHGCRVEVLPI